MNGPLPRGADVAAYSLPTVDATAGHGFVSSGGTDSAPLGPAFLVSPVGGREPPQVPDHVLLRVVGRGAYGEVWLARNTLGTARAVKVVHRDDFGDARPFDREFRGIRKYEPVSRSHEGLIDILQVGQTESGNSFYYVMELADATRAAPSDTKDLGGPATDGRGSVPGTSPGGDTTLSDYTPRSLRHELQVRGRLPMSECLEIVESITGGLAHLHAAGLVHRDVKPSNIVFVGEKAKLADIGLVTDAGDARSMVGTDGYLPPEGAGSPEADVYSLGKVLYEIMTGLDRRRFPELPAEPGAPGESGVARELNLIVLKACARDPRERYPSAAGLVRDLERVRRGRSLRQQHAWQSAYRRSRPFLPALWVALTLALGAVWLGRQPAAPKDSTTPGSGLGPAAERAAVFVLPFRVEAETPDGPGLRGAIPGRMTDAFIDGLASLPGVRRSPRRSGWISIDEGELRQSLAATNDLRHVLTGRLRGTNGTLELDLRLYPRPGGEPVWVGSVRGRTNDVPGLERVGLEKLTQALGIRPTSSEWSEIDRLLRANDEARRRLDEAWELYERDCMKFTSYSRMIALCDEARRLDPLCLDAVLGRAVIQRDLALFTRPASEIWPVNQREMEAILKVDGTHGGALNLMCTPAWYRDWDWNGNDAWVQRELPLEPPVSRHFIAAIWLRSHGNLDQAKVEQGLTEQADFWNQARGFHALAGRWVHGEYDEGLRLAHHLLDLLPNRIWPYYWVAHLNVARGDFEAGLEAINRFDQVNRVQSLTALRGYAYARMGQRQKAYAVLADLEDQPRSQGGYLQPYHPARIRAALGETELALDWLEKAEQDRSEYLVFADLPGSLRIDPAWRGMEQHPRFQALLKKVGLGVWPVPIRPLDE